MTGSPDEQTLILSAQRGDLEAFNLLVDRYQDSLFRVAYRILGDEDSAADAAQIAWLAAFRKLNQFRWGRLSSWLMHILVNTCYDQIRLRNRRGEVALYPERDDRDDFETPCWLLDPAPSVEDHVDTRHTKEIVQQALESVPAVFRTMVILVDIEGLRYEEAAAALRVPLGTVRSRLARGRMALRRQLEQSGALTDGRQQPAVSLPVGPEVRCR